MMTQADIVMDFDRQRRCGVAEAVLCEFKTLAQYREKASVAKI